MRFILSCMQEREDQQGGSWVVALPFLILQHTKVQTSLSTPHAEQKSVRVPSKKQKQKQKNCRSSWSTLSFLHKGVAYCARQHINKQGGRETFPWLSLMSACQRLSYNVYWEARTSSTHQSPAATQYRSPDTILDVSKWIITIINNIFAVRLNIHQENLVWMFLWKFRKILRQSIPSCHWVN